MFARRPVRIPIAIRAVTYRITERHHFGICARHAQQCARRDAKRPVCSENTLDPLCSPAPRVVARIRNSSSVVACRTPCSPLRSGVLNETPKGGKRSDPGECESGGFLPARMASGSRRGD